MKEIPNYKGYFAFEEGKVWSEPKGTSNPKGKFLKATLQHKGYLVVSIVQNGFKLQRTLHSLIALTFCEKSSNTNQVNHINGNKLDNRKENLEWVNNSENCLHRDRLNLRRRIYGEEHKNHKLTEIQARQIKEQKGKKSQYQLARQFNISQAQISLIHRNIAWPHL